MLILAFAVWWLGCGLIAWGLWVTYFQSQFPSIAYRKRGEDFRGGSLALLFGPFALVVEGVSAFTRWDWRLFYFVPYEPTMHGYKREGFLYHD